MGGFQGTKNLAIGDKTRGDEQTMNKERTARTERGDNKKDERARPAWHS